MSTGSSVEGRLRERLVRAAARLHLGHDDQAAHCLVALRARGERPPLFFVQPAFAGAFAYDDLARSLGPSQPFYSLQLPDSGAGAPAAVGSPEAEEALTIDAVAARYVEAIRSVPVEEPYLLGGWSFGGIGALAVAQQLEALGRKVGLLILLDTVAPQPLRQAEDVDWLVVLAAFLGSLGVESTAEGLRAMGPDELVSFTRGGLVGAGLVPPSTTEESVRRYLRVHRANIESLRRYLPRPYSGDILLLRVAPAPGEEKDLGWSRLALGGLEVETIPGDHYSLLRHPDVETLARRISAALSRLKR